MSGMSWSVGLWCGVYDVCVDSKILSLIVGIGGSIGGTVTVTVTYRWLLVIKKAVCGDETALLGDHD